MILGSNTLAGSSLGGTVAGSAGVPIPPQPVVAAGFHAALADWMYPQTLERERVTLYGNDARAYLIAVTPAGDELIHTLTTGPWVPRRIPTIESGGDETWRLEVTGELVDWDTLKQVTKIQLRGATDEEQIYEVLDKYNAMKPGKVYHIRMQAICNIDPS